MINQHQQYLQESVNEIHTEIAQVLADPACPAHIVKALGRLQDWLGQYEVAEIVRCKASLIEMVRQYGCESREFQWLMAN